ARLLLGDELDQVVGHPHDGVAGLVPGPPYRPGHAVIGPVRKRIPIDDEQRPRHGTSRSFGGTLPRAAADVTAISARSGSGGTGSPGHTGASLPAGAPRSPADRPRPCAPRGP